jgi:thiamine-phosphate pyrophosphorylase
VRPRVIVIATELGHVLRLAPHVARMTADPSWAIHVRVTDGDPEYFARCMIVAERFGVPTIASVSSVDAHAESARYGIHLGGAARSTLRAARAELGGGRWISVPAHDDRDVSDAAAGGATAVYVSPIFETPNKGAPRGLDAIASARELAGETRIYALGGITPENAASCVARGADGVAVIRAVVDAPDPGSALLAIDAAVAAATIAAVHHGW